MNIFLNICKATFAVNMWSVDKRRAYSSFEQPGSPASKDPFHPWTVPQLPTVMPWWASSCFFLIKQVTDCSDHLPRKPHSPESWSQESTKHLIGKTHVSLSHFLNHSSQSTSKNLQVSWISSERGSLLMCKRWSTIEIGVEHSQKDM